MISSSHHPMISASHLQLHLYLYMNIRSKTKVINIWKNFSPAAGYFFQAFGLILFKFPILMMKIGAPVLGGHDGAHVMLMLLFVLLLLLLCCCCHFYCLPACLPACLSQHIAGGCCLPHSWWLNSICLPKHTASARALARASARALARAMAGS